MDLQLKIYRSAAAIVAGFVASHAVALAWRLATGQTPPQDNDDLTLTTSSVVVFAGLLGAATAIAQTLATRQALRTVAKRERRTVEEGLGQC
jgi:hypothetical protein